MSGERRFDRKSRDAPRATKGVIIFLAVFAALGIGITLLFQHHDVWTPDQLLIAP
jgi:hypothetical protein